MKMKFKDGELEVEAMFSDLVKLDSPADPLEPHNDDLSSHATAIVDPVGDFFAKAAKQAKGATTSTDFDLLKALSETDSRDKEPAVAVLRKDAAIPDWSWSTRVADDAPLSKRATPGTRERFERQLAEFFRNHDEELAEARAIVDKMIADERAEILSEA